MARSILCDGFVSRGDHLKIHISKDKCRPAPQNKSAIKKLSAQSPGMIVGCKCGQNFKANRELIEHLREDFMQTKGNFISGFWDQFCKNGRWLCFKCRQSWGDRESLKKHIKSKKTACFAPGVAWYCSCSQTFNTGAELVDHMRERCTWNKMKVMGFWDQFKEEKQRGFSSCKYRCPKCDCLFWKAKFMEHMEADVSCARK